MTDTVAPREGGYYRTRGGGIEGPIRETSSDLFPFARGLATWQRDGHKYASKEKSEYDLIAEVYVSDTPPPPPVDYNDGQWHLWPGGECPVHPQSTIQWMAWGIATSCGGTIPAGEIIWAGVTAFRVIKQHKEPREWWVVPDLITEVFETEAEANARGYANPIRVREVTDE